MRRRAVLIGLGLWAFTVTRERDASAAPELSVAQATRTLTGGKSKDWIFIRFETILGSEDRCKRGQIWRFKSNGGVEIRTCVAGRPKVVHRKWRIEKKNALDLMLVVAGGKRYILRLPQPKKGSEVEQMRLRSIATTSTEPTVDMRFTHERD